MDKLKETEKFTLYKLDYDRRNKLNIEKSLEELEDYLKKLIMWNENNWSEMTKRVNRNVGLSNSATWNPGNIASGSFEAKEVTVTGAALGDYARASFSLDVQDLIMTANVTAANTVTAILANNTAGAVNLAEGTIYVEVIER